MLPKKGIIGIAFSGWNRYVIGELSMRMIWLGLI